MDALNVVPIESFIATNPGPQATSKPTPAGTAKSHEPAGQRRRAPDVFVEVVGWLVG